MLLDWKQPACSVDRKWLGWAAFGCSSRTAGHAQPLAAAQSSAPSAPAAAGWLFWLLQPLLQPSQTCPAEQVEQCLVINSYHIGGRIWNRCYSLGKELSMDCCCLLWQAMLQLKFKSQNSKMCWEHGSSVIFKIWSYISVLLFAGTCGIQRGDAA